MTLKLRLEAASIEELRATALAALGLDTGAIAAAAPAETVATIEILTSEKPAETVDATPELVTEGVKSAKVKTGRKPKKAKAEPEPEPEPKSEAKIDAKTEEPKKLSRDAVRHVFDLYVQNFGLGAAQIDGPILLKRIFGNGIGRIGDVPEDDQGKLGQIVAAVEMAIAKNEFDRKSVRGGCAMTMAFAPSDGVLVLRGPDIDPTRIEIIKGENGDSDFVQITQAMPHGINCPLCGHFCDCNSDATTGFDLVSARLLAESLLRLLDEHLLNQLPSPKAAE